MLLGLSMTHPAMAQADAPRMARGLIVKLKDSAQPTSVVRLQAASRPTDSDARQRLRLAAATQRTRVSYLVNRPTAFAARVIHNGSVTSLAAAEAQAARLRLDPDVEWVVVNEIERQAATALTIDHQTINDPSYGIQTWLRPRTGSTLGVADVPTAWTLMAGRTITPVVTAVLDTGILAPGDLSGRVLPGYDFVSDADYARDGNGLDSDPSDPGDWLTSGEKLANPQIYPAGCEVRNSVWHGLAISSMLGAGTDNNSDGAGILAPLPGAVVLPVRVAGTCGADVSDIIEGMLWAAGVDYQGSPTRNANPARVINISFGGDGSCSDNTSGTASWLYRQTMTLLRNKGVLVVASAGNGSSTTGMGLATLTRPANCPYVLAATGLNQRGYKARYANLVNSAQHWSVAVASGDIDGSNSLTDDGIATQANTGSQSPDVGSYDMRLYVGTSFAAPTAAGVAALMMSVDPSLTVDEVLNWITSTAAAFPVIGGQSTCNTSNLGNCNCTTSTCGAGVLDAGAALQAAIDHAALNLPAFVSPDLTASYLTPDRLQTITPTPSKSGGGGGALDVKAILALVAALILIVLIRIRDDKR